MRGSVTWFLGNRRGFEVDFEHDVIWASTLVGFIKQYAVYVKIISFIETYDYA